MEQAVFKRKPFSLALSQTCSIGIDNLLEVVGNPLSMANNVE